MKDKRHSLKYRKEKIKIAKNRPKSIQIKMNKQIKIWWKNNKNSDKVKERNKKISITKQNTPKEIKDEIYRKVAESNRGQKRSKESRKKMSKAMCIHHINGNHYDNRPENLMLLSKSEHTKLHIKQGDTFPYGIGRRKIKRVKGVWVKNG